MLAEYGLNIPEEIERRLGRCRASVRDQIRHRLREIAAAAGKIRGRPKRVTSSEPALRFYVYEGYRVFYRLEPETRSVVVTDLGVRIGE